MTMSEDKCKQNNLYDTIQNLESRIVRSPERIKNVCVVLCCVSLKMSNLKYFVCCFLFGQNLREMDHQVHDKQEELTRLRHRNTFFEQKNELMNKLIEVCLFVFFVVFCVVCCVTHGGR